LALTACFRSSTPRLDATARQNFIFTDIQSLSTTSTTVSSSGITITFDKTADWDAGSGVRGFTATVTILNQSGNVLEDWDLRFHFLATITTMWNATFEYAATSDRYFVFPESWNATLANNQSRSVGFQGSYSGVFQPPTSYILSGLPIGEQTPSEPITPACTLDTTFVVTADWQNGDGTRGFVAEMYLTNTGAYPFNWQLAFDLDADITTMWHASYTRENSRYSVSPASWNTRIEPGQTLSFGFLGSTSGTLSEPQGVSCGEDGNEDDGDDDSDDDTSPNTLPEPWQQITIGDGTATASYNPDTATFTSTLNATAESTHFIYQSTPQDASIVAKVQRPVSSAVDAKAGVMLRQSNEASSPYVFVYLQGDSVSVDYRDAGNQVVTTEGSSVSAADTRYLKLERKEGRVYVYESDEGVSFSLVTTILLSLVSPYYTGLATSSTAPSQASFQEVQVQAQGDINADFIASPASGTVPLTVQFAATPHDPALSYHWDFGDGTTATGQAISHTFTSPGAYFVRLSVSQGQSSETVGRHVIVQSQRQADGYYTVNPGDTIVGVDGVTFVTAPSYATGASRLRIERTALPEDVPAINLQSYERLVSPYYEVFSPDVDVVASPNSRERQFYIGIPVPEGVDGRKVTIYGAVFSDILCDPMPGFDGNDCSEERYWWSDFSSDGFYYPASNMYYAPVPSYPSGKPEYFVMLEWTGSPRNISRETLPWEDSGANLNLITPLQVAVPVDVDAAESENFVIRCHRNFEGNNSTACTDLAEDIVGVAQDAYDYLRRHGFGAPYSRTNADGRHIIDVHPTTSPTSEGSRCSELWSGYVWYARRQQVICLGLNQTSITELETDRTYTIAHEMFHDIAHNPDVVGARIRPYKWWVEGTATFAAGTIRGCTGNAQCQTLELDPRLSWFPRRLDIGFFDDAGLRPYQLQEFWLYLATEAGATNLGFLLPLFEVEGGPSATSFDMLLRNGGMNGYVVEGGFAELYYNWVASILGYTDDSTGGGYGDADRVCTTCSVPAGERFGTITDLLPDAQGNTPASFDLNPLNSVMYRLVLAEGQTLTDVVAGLELEDPNGNLQYFVFEDEGFAYIVIVNTDINPTGGTSSGGISISPEVTPCQGAACPGAGPSAGYSWGDPHINTFDGYFYTFMATGDYVLVESRVDELMIQVRYRPFNNNGNEWSANEAVAMNIHGDIVEFYGVKDFAQPLTLINGIEIPSGNALIPLPNGGLVRLEERSASATWMDGSTIWLQLHKSGKGGDFLAGIVQVKLLANRWGTVQGLLGNNDGDQLNDLRLRNGSKLSLDPFRDRYEVSQALYSGPFRSSWLVQSNESLFSRGVNRFDPFYPTRVVRLDDFDPAIVAAAAQACHVEGVVTTEVLSRCILDIAITDDIGFARFAAAVDPQVPGVAISPRALYFSSVTSRELTAFVKGVENDTVIWSTTGGIVNGSGQTVSYTPPAEHGTYTITATLAADPSISDTVRVVVGTPLVIAPSEVVLLPGTGQRFTAFGAEGQSVIWSTSAGQLSGPGRTVSYIPPADGGTYTVTARLAADSSVVATATVQVVGTALTPSHLNLLPGESVPVTWLNAAPFEPVWSATGGSISGAGESVTYTAPTTTGTYTITATSSDEVLTANATVTVATSFPPIARDINVAGNPNETLDLDPLWNDSDPRNERLTIVAISTPEHGTASILPGGELIRYTPATDYEGVDSFSYTIENERGERASAVIYLTIGFGGYSMQSGGGNAE
jgi:PKD repeat protein